MRRISTPTGGPSLQQMRNLFCTNVRSVLFYTCPSWNIPDDSRDRGKWREVIEGLESAQYKCLLIAAGAMKRTSRHVIWKELNIESVEVLLNRQAKAHRARHRDSAHHDHLRSMIRCPVKARGVSEYSTDLGHLVLCDPIIRAGRLDLYTRAYGNRQKSRVCFVAVV